MSNVNTLQGISQSLRGLQNSNPLQALLNLLKQVIGGLFSGAGNHQTGRMMGTPNFGGNNSSQANAPGNNVSNFLGSSPNVSNNVGQGTAMGRQIANIAARTTDQKGYCFRAVAKTLSKFGVNLSGRSAYMAADQLARNPKFREVRVPRNQLKSLPAGAVVVWNKGAGLPHGHIGIALGDGREASWKTRPQLMLNTSYRVFMPK